MRIGITGSTGLIGTALVKALEQRGDQLVIFQRPSSAPSPHEVIRWNPATGDVDESDLARVGGLDAVVHLAGAGIADKRWSKDRKAEILHSRTNSTSLLVKALTSLPSGVGVLASGSAIGYYGSRGDEILDESSTKGSDFLSDVCQQWEDAALPFAETGANVSFLRTGIVQSTKGGALKKQLPLFRLGLTQKLGNGRQWISPIAIDDEIRAILWVIEKKITGPINLTAPEPVTNAKFTKELAKSLHRTAFGSVPAVALKIVLGAQLASDAVLASQRVLPKVLLNSGFTFETPDTAQILRQVLLTGH